jgi:sugar/nucleoside kinase (ribokinase family)
VDILVIGYNALDVVVPVTGAAPPDTKCEVSRIGIWGGGPGATAAVALARLGARVRLVTVFGDDEGARIQERELAAAGVDLTLSVTADGHASPRAVILVDPQDGTRTIYWSRGDLPALSVDAVDACWLDGIDLLYCDGHEPAAAAVLAGRARARGLPVVLDAGNVRPGSAELVARCTDVVSSDVFAPRLTGEADPVRALRALRRRGPARVAMTFGAAGVLALAEDGEAVFHVPAYDVPAVDTTGAGDAFHAGFAYARARGDGWADALDLGAAVAALGCTAWGGREGLPDLAAAERLRSQGRRRRDRPGG